MAARIIAETDIIDVSRPPVLLFGEPGVGKTSLGQTANKSLTLDFDQGLHRSAFRKTGLRFDSWGDVVEFQQGGGFNDYETIVLDTIGTLLEYLGQSIIKDNAKMGTRAGGLSLQGWGALKTTFGNWLSGLRQAGKQVIMIAHQKEEKEGEEWVLRPDIAGGSYSIVMNCADIVGYMSYRNNVRHIGWEPTDRYFAKNGAQLKSGPIPDFKLSPHFMAELLTTAKQNLGHTAEASAAVARVVDEWRQKLTDKTLAEFNAALPGMKDVATGGPKAQVWKIAQDIAAASKWTFDDAKKVFVASSAAPENPDADVPPTKERKFKPIITKAQFDAIECEVAIWGGSIHGKYPDGTPILPEGKSQLKQLTGTEADAILRGLKTLNKGRAA